MKTLTLDNLEQPTPILWHNECMLSYLLFPKPTPPDFISTHIHHTYELIFFYEGDADYSVAGEVYSLKKYDLLLIKPSTYHNIILHSSHPYERTICNFRESHIPQELIEPLRNLDPYYHIPPDSPLFHLLDSLKLTVKCISDQKDLQAFYLQILPAIILHLKHLDSYAAKETIPIHSTIEKIIYYIDENPMKPLSLSDLAKTFYLSESHIAHLFKKHLNTSATQYINRKKIIYAQTLILSGMPPAVAAEKCSYESYATFYRQYKKYLGVPPMHDFAK